jgi:hypothetical protein
MAKVQALDRHLAWKRRVQIERTRPRLLAQLILESGTPSVVPGGSGLAAEQAFVDLVTERLGKNPRAQRWLLGLLAGPSPKLVAFSGDPTRSAHDGRALDALIDAAFRGRAKYGRYMRDRVDLTILPAIAVEQRSVGSVLISKQQLEPSKDKRRKPDVGDSATLPPAPQRPLAAAAAELGESLASELKSGPLGEGLEKLAGLTDLDRALAHAKERYAAATAPVIEALNEYLATLEGLTLEDLSLNKRLGSKVAGFARALGLRFECPTCGRPSSLSVSKASRMELGAFRFKHAGSSPGSQINHGGSRAIPRLRLIPPDRN